MSESETNVAEVKKRTRKKKSGKRKRRRGGFLVKLALAGGLGFAAPIIVAKTSLKDHVLGAILGERARTVHIAEVELNWLEPIRLTHVELVTEDGDAPVTIESVQTKRPLWELVTHLNDTVQISVDRPKIRAEVDSDGTSLDGIVESMIGTESSSSNGAPPFSYTLQINDGVVEISHARTHQTTIFDDVDVTVQQHKSEAFPSNVTLATNVFRVLAAETNPESTERRQSGRIQLQIASAEVSDDFVTTASPPPRLELQADRLAIAALNPLLAMLDEQAHVDGLFNGTVTCSLTDGDSRLISGDVECAARYLHIESPRFLKSDRVTLDRIDANGSMSISRDEVRFDNLRLDTDIATVTADGRWQPNLGGGEANGVPQPRDPDSSRGIPIHSVGLATDTSAPLTMKVECDLAALAGMIPETLSLHEDVEILEARLTGTVEHTVTADGDRLQGSLSTPRLLARRADQPIRWEQPIEASFDVRMFGGVPVLQEIECNSDFLSINGTGSLDRADIVADCDLDRLSERLGQLIDFGSTKLSGTGTVNAGYQTSKNGQFDVAARMIVTDFKLRESGREPWTEQRLIANVIGAGRIVDRSVESFSSLRVQLMSGRDQFVATSGDGFTVGKADEAIVMRTHITGSIANWHHRVRPWLSSSDWNADGVIDASSDITISTTGIRLDSTVASVESLAVDGPSVRIREPQVTVSTSAAWRSDVGRLTLTDTSVSSETLALTSPRFEFSLKVANPVGEPQIEPTVPGEQEPSAISGGRMNLTADLDRLADWFPAIAVEQGIELSGQLASQLEVSHESESTLASWSAEVTNLNVVRIPNKSSGYASDFVAEPARWNDPKITFAGRGALNTAQDQMRLDQLNFSSSIHSFTANGQIDEWSGQRVADLQGTTTIDLAHLTSWLAAVSGVDIELNGRKTQEFLFRGAIGFRSSVAPSYQDIVENELSASFGTAWDSGRLLELPIGPQVVDLVMKDRVVNVTPIDTNFGGGQITFEPKLRLDPDGPILFLRPGSSADGVTLTPAICRSWLRYVSPILAEASEVDGEFSSTIHQARVPLMDHQRSDVLGVLVIHHATARPAGSAEELVLAVRQFRDLAERRRPSSSNPLRSTTLRLDEQNVDFRLTDGRVHHRGLQLTIDDITVTTSGSVGLDDTVSITAEIPLREEWRRENRLLARYPKGSIQIPITGTLNRPQVDRRFLAELARGFAGSAVQDVIEDNLNLDRLQDKLGGLLD